MLVMATPERLVLFRWVDDVHDARGICCMRQMALETLEQENLIASSIEHEEFMGGEDRVAVARQMADEEQRRTDDDADAIYLAMEEKDLQEYCTPDPPDELHHLVRQEALEELDRENMIASSIEHDEFMGGYDRVAVARQMADEEQRRTDDDADAIYLAMEEKDLQEYCTPDPPDELHHLVRQMALEELDRDMMIASSIGHEELMEEERAAR